MPTIFFHGFSYPRELQISIQDHPTVKWNDAEVSLDIEFAITIQNSYIQVKCDLTSFEPERDLVRVFMRAFDLARATIDLTCFSTGWGLSVILDKYTNPEGQTTPFAPHDPRLSKLCTAFHMGPATSIEENSFNQVLTLVLGDWRIFRVLRELIEAATLPHESAVNCARAIEGLRHLIAPPDVNRPQAWASMRDTLNLSESYLKLITDISIQPRHGEHVHIPGGKTTEVAHRSWTIMNRFLEYKKRGSTPLPAEQFPLLT